MLGFLLIAGNERPFDSSLSSNKGRFTDPTLFGFFSFRNFMLGLLRELWNFLLVLSCSSKSSIIESYLNHEIMIRNLIELIITF